MEKKNYPYEKLKHLREIVKRSESAMVAFSGGADSTLLLRIAVDELGSGAVAITARSAIHPQRETDNARPYRARYGSPPSAAGDGRAFHARIYQES